MWSLRESPEDKNKQRSDTICLKQPSPTCYQQSLWLEMSSRIETKLLNESLIVREQNDLYKLYCSDSILISEPLLCNFDALCQADRTDLWCELERCCGASCVVLASRISGH